MLLQILILFAQRLISRNITSRFSSLFLFALLYNMRVPILLFLNFNMFNKFIFKRNNKYIAKTERCLQTRLLEHSSNINTSAVAQHLLNYPHAQYLANLNSFYDNLFIYLSIYLKYFERYASSPIKYKKLDKIHNYGN